MGRKLSGAEGWIHGPNAPNLEARTLGDTIDPAQLIEVALGSHHGGDMNDLVHAGIADAPPLVGWEVVAVEVGAFRLIYVPDELVPGICLDVPPVHVGVDDAVDLRRH